MRKAQTIGAAAGIAALLWWLSQTEEEEAPPDDLGDEPGDPTWDFPLAVDFADQAELAGLVERYLIDLGLKQALQDTEWMDRFFSDTALSYVLEWGDLATDQDQLLGMLTDSGLAYEQALWAAALMDSLLEAGVGYARALAFAVRLAPEVIP